MISESLKTFASRVISKFFVALGLLMPLCLASAALAAGPSNSDLAKYIQQRNSDLDIKRVKITDRTEGQGIMGTVHDGLFTATASTKEPLYVVVKEYRSGTIIRQVSPAGQKVVISGGFVAGRDAGIWDFDLRRVKFTPSLGKTRAQVSFRRKPIEVAGSAGALEIVKSEDRRLMELRREDEARAEAARKRQETKDKRAAAEAARIREKANQRRELEALEESYEKWEDETAEKLVGEWEGALLHGIPPEPFYSSSTGGKYPECHGFLRQRLVVVEDSYNDFHSFLKLGVETNYQPDMSGKIVETTRGNYTRIVLDGKTKTVRFAQPWISFSCKIDNSNQRGTLDFFKSRHSKMIGGTIDGDTLSFSPQEDVMKKNGELDYRLYSGVFKRLPQKIE